MNTTMILAAMSADDIINAMPAELGQSIRSNAGVSNGDGEAEATSTTNPAKKPKRPVNGFMAFRSRYFKIFPSMIQKDASALLTMLWAKDPWKHRWGLVAKVYSFVRDEMSSRKLTLGQFLDIACPIMALPKANEYLVALGWTMFRDHNGHLTGTQDLSGIGIRLAQLSGTARIPPNSELELLTMCIAGGFAGHEGSRLVTKMGCKDNMLMAVDPEGHARPTSDQEHHLQKRLALYETIRNDPASITANLLAVERTSVSADVVYVNDFHQGIDFNLTHRRATTAAEEPTVQIQHSYAMNDIVDNTLTYRYAYHLPASHMTSSLPFNLDVSAHIPEYQDRYQAGLDNPIFLDEIVQASERREEQRRQMALTQGTFFGC